MTRYNSVIPGNGKTIEVVAAAGVIGASDSDVFLAIDDNFGPLSSITIRREDAWNLVDDLLRVAGPKPPPRTARDDWDELPVGSIVQVIGRIGEVESPIYYKTSHAHATLLSGRIATFPVAPTFLTGQPGLQVIHKGGS
jgi:hypothetical protein